MLETCSTNEKVAVLIGTAVVKDFVLIGIDNQTQSTGGGNGSVSGGSGSPSGSVATGKGWKNGADAGWAVFIAVACAYVELLL